MKSSGLKRVDILTLFPGMFEGPLSQSLLGRARDRGLIDLRIRNLRDFSADDRHKTVDDRPYGGGAGMVLQPEPIFRAIKAIRASVSKDLLKNSKPYVIYLSPQGRVLNQKISLELAQRPWITLICGHYEGVDERIMDLVDEEVSIGDYVLTGGELPAMVLAEAIIRLVPGVVQQAESIANDSFQQGLLDHPHYTRPALWRGKKVPEVLLSGDHKKIRDWRTQQARGMTSKKRPDLLTTNSRRRI